MLLRGKIIFKDIIYFLEILTSVIEELNRPSAKEISLEQMLSKVICSSAEEPAHRAPQIWSTMTKILTFPKIVTRDLPMVMNQEGFAMIFNEFVSYITNSSDSNLLLVHSESDEKSFSSEELHSQLVIGMVPQFVLHLRLSKVTSIMAKFGGDTVPSAIQFLGESTDPLKRSYLQEKLFKSQVFTIIDIDTPGHSEARFTQMLKLLLDKKVRLLILGKHREILDLWQQFSNVSNETNVESFELTENSMMQEIV
jgi:hypothetical protein